MLGFIALAAMVATVGILKIVERRSPGRARRQVGWPGPGASGAIYDLLNQDKRNAIELIVEEKAAATDPERADGNLPQLENPKRFQ